MPLLSRRRSTIDVLFNDLNFAASDPAATTTAAAAHADDNAVGKKPAAPPAPGPAAALSSSPTLDAVASFIVPRLRRPSTAHPLSEGSRSFDSPARNHSERPDSPPVQDATPAHGRFSRLRWRHFSDTQLAATARAHAEQEERPPLPDPSPPLPPLATTAPAIITTAPTMDPPNPTPTPPKKPKSPFKRQMSKFTSSKHLLANNSSNNHSSTSLMEKKPMRQSTEHSETPKHLGPWRKSFDRKERRDDHVRPMPAADSAPRNPAPPAYGDESNSALALPLERLSVSSAGDRSSSEHVTYATTTTTHTISTTTTLFKLPRRNRRKSLFPLPPKFEPPPEQIDLSPASPRASTSAISTHSNIETPGSLGPTPRVALHRRHTEVSRPRLFTSSSVSPSHNSLARSAIAFAAHPGAPLIRNDSTHSANSARSSNGLAPPRRTGLRDRSSTMGSLGRTSEDLTPPTPPNQASGRTSTSTSGRTSLGGFLNLNRFRHGSDPNARNSSPGHSKTGSFALASREALIIPDREEGDTPGKYLERLQATVSRSLIAGILSKSADPFAQAVLRSYSRKFPFFGEPIDMSLRKFLLEAELPKETQQVDRVIQAFADRYHECNPGIFQSPDKAYIVAFSLMMLHTDAFNKNNKRKMQKQDYVKNTSGQNVSDDILACFYDNICYTPFIHFDEEVDINGERLLTFKPKKSKLRGTMPDPVRKTSGPIDPYALICDGKLDVLRPPIKEAINTDDPYTYLGTAGTLDIHRLQRAFVNTGILQIISARSRPAAFESQATRDNPNDTAAGVVDLKITKVGLLWRKNPKRKKARSPWQEWGAIMTGSQLYLFKNINWIKGLMAQQQAHNKQATNAPVIFNPPIQDFKPDALIKTDDAVALLDSSYTRHKDAFTLVRHGGQEEVLLAENESEMNEWIALLNYAAAFRSAGVRIRGFIGCRETDASAPKTKDQMALSNAAGQALPDATSTQPVAPQLVHQVLVFRGQIMRQTIFESEREIEQMTNSLETMLRNARHLLLLAPIQQRTREEVSHAAARLNAMLKWVRRDIWRLKCYRDILAHDLEIDNDLLQGKAAPSNGLPPPPSSPPVTRAQAGGPHWAKSSQPSQTTAPSVEQPQSPRLRGATESAAEEFFGNDVFKTPPEHNRKSEINGEWKLPSLDMNAERNQDRLSVTSSSHAFQRKHSTAGLSTTSSAYDRQYSFAGSDALSRPGLGDHAPSFDDREREVLMLARDDLAPTVTGTSAVSAGKPQAFDFASGSTPQDSASKPKNRRSLHRTLRDVRNEHSSIHRHRKGKDSASTVHSDTSHVGDLPAEGAPVLERSTGKFIVHGKKASVVTFGGDWTEEKMRVRMELEARNQTTIGEAEESGPEANLRRHLERQMAASEDLDGFTSDSTAPPKHRTLSDADTFVSSIDHDHDRFEPASISAPHLGSFDHGHAGLLEREEEPQGYFNLGQAQSPSQAEDEVQKPVFKQPNFSPPTSEVIREPTKDIAPEQLPLPLSPPDPTPENVKEDDTAVQSLGDGAA
ncbi:hypothetical protein AAFC00_004055 [Neodothiora populina]|uniref:Guanyl-nucleotide exchange factor n=1 Tax=Neodothiora populina TaxID=2781224 RepID=A0ABR3PIE0_9PEZI